MINQEKQQPSRELDWTKYYSNKEQHLLKAAQKEAEEYSRQLKYGTKPKQTKKQRKELRNRNYGLRPIVENALKDGAQGKNVIKMSDRTYVGRNPVYVFDEHKMTYVKASPGIQFVRVK